MRTLYDFRVRYARYADSELLQLLADDPQTLTPEARQALAEEAARRGGVDGIEARLKVRAAIANTNAEPRRKQQVYTKAGLGARLGAYIVDRIIGMGPAIVAAIISFFFKLSPPSAAIAFLNLLGTGVWAVYYGLLKDSRNGGQSIGKAMFGLMVVNVDTNEPCSGGESATRAIVGGLVGVVPIVGWLIEPIVATVRDDGRRLGDQAADTQVIAAAQYSGTGDQAD